MHFTEFAFWRDSSHWRDVTSHRGLIFLSALSLHFHIKFRLRCECDSTHVYVASIIVAAWSLSCGAATRHLFSPWSYSPNFVKLAETVFQRTQSRTERPSLHSLRSQMSMDQASSPPVIGNHGGRGSVASMGRRQSLSVDGAGDKDSGLKRGEKKIGKIWNFFTLSSQSIDWLIDCHVACLIDWLIDWLIDCVFMIFFICLIAFLATCCYLHLRREWITFLFFPVCFIVILGRPARVFWDLENCCVGGKDYFAEIIRTIQARVEADTGHDCFEIYAAYDHASHISGDIYQELLAYDVSRWLIFSKRNT